MISKRGFAFRVILRWSYHIMLLILVYNVFVALLYHFSVLNVSMPWIPVSILGTAVAFYVGFKNNQSYDRMWEARKIWGSITNDSRSWAVAVMHMVTNSGDTNYTEEQLLEIKKHLIYRHIAWLYKLRKQLLVPTDWEHVSQKGFVGWRSKKGRIKYGIGRVAKEEERLNMLDFLTEEEMAHLSMKKNKAVHVIDMQTAELAKLKKQGLLNDFCHVHMQKILNNLYDYQGQCERIKKFPLPRQYSNISTLWVAAFIMLIPFTVIPEMLHESPWYTLLAIIISTLISAVYVTMENVGDYSENPFEGMPNDIPMFSTCRSIEIDLREILGEKEVPPIIRAKDGILM
ncbi:MAG: bestrophin family protein [Mangrovibacterium sp.]